MLSHFNRTALLLFVLGATACGGPSAVNPASMLAPNAGRGSVPKYAPDRGPSWVSRDSRGQTLLYVSDEATGSVHMYSYPSGTAAGKLTHLDQPTGLCADAAANVWIVENGSATIAKFAHAGKKPIANLTSPGLQNLIGCAVDPASGNLAATSLLGTLLVYANAKGTPTQYHDATLVAFYFCAYDNGGNLFVDGVDAQGHFGLTELPNGSGSLHDVRVTGDVTFPGGLQWDGTYLATGDQAYQGTNKSVIYQISVSGSSGSIEGTTQLAGSCDVLGFAIASGDVTAPDVCESLAAIYRYPAGGKRVKTLKGFTFPFGAAISPAGSPFARSRAGKR